MKKLKHFAGALLLAATLSTAFYVYKQQNSPEKILLRRNIEALANSEGENIFGTCGWGVRRTYYNEYGQLVIEGEGGCGMPKDEAIKEANAHLGNWCCESCGSTWYCGSGS